MNNSILDNIISSLKCSTDPGISIELKDCLESDDNIAEYRIEITEDQYYRVTAELKEFGVQQAKKSFLNVLHFIEYAGGTFYIRQKDIDCVKYQMVSSTDNNRGFVCHFIFVLNQ